MLTSKAQEACLITQAKLGVREAFDELIKRSYHRVLSFVCSHRDIFQEREDITQEAFLEAYKRIRSFKGLSSFATWVRSIAYHMIKHKRRKMKSSPFFLPLNENELPSFDKSPREVIEFNEVESCLSRFIATLPPKEKEVFVLRVLDYVPYRGLCRQTHQSLAAAKRAFNRANHKWHRFLNKELLGDYEQAYIQKED